MENNKLKVKDLVNIGIFSALYMVISMIVKTQFFNLDSDSELVFGMENLGIEPNKINARVQEVAHGLIFQ